MASAVDMSPPMNAWSDQMPNLGNIPLSPSVAPATNQSRTSPDRLAEAIEFSGKADDGLNPQLWREAELVIVGLSGMGKTPISKHLASMGYKVANFPLVCNCSIPQELFQIEQRRVVGLMIRPDVLLSIRRERSYQWGVSLTRADFTDYEEIQEEVKWAKRLYRENPDWKVVKTTDRDPKEVAVQIAQWLDSGLVD